MVKKDVETEYCHLRKAVFGLEGCHNCPIACGIQPSNLNMAENYKYMMEKLKKRLRSK